MNDDRISQHLRQQAEGISLTPADPAGAMRRGSRRRTRRRVGLLGSIAAVGVLATSVAVREPGRDQKITLGAPNAVASTYEWSTVTPESGLAWGNEAVLLSDGSVYSISTAPGPYREGDEAQYAATLYRSSDGREWSPASLPSGVRSSDLAGAGDTLYSIGTSPSGGIVLSSSRDGAASWSSTDLPSEVVGLQARHPGKIVLGPVKMAAKDATHMVVSLTATTNLDLPTYKPEYPHDEYLPEWDDTGVKVFENPRAQCVVTDTTMVTDSTMSGAEVEAERARRGELEVCQSEPQSEPERGDQVAAFTYDELGITGELRDHLGGVPYVYATDDGESFHRVDLPETERPAAELLYVASPVAVSDGYRLVVPGNEQTTVLRSADGFTWEPSSTLAGSGGGPVGVLNGRAALSTWDPSGFNVLQVENADGSWSPINVAAAVGSDSPHAYAEHIAFGPLGVAAIVMTYADNEAPTYHLVHSTDGSTLQVLHLTDQVPRNGSVSGAVVTADAIAVRISEASDGDRSTAPTQRVFVGTPTS